MSSTHSDSSDSCRTLSCLRLVDSSDSSVERGARGRLWTRTTPLLMSLSDATCYESERRAAAGPREAALEFKPYSNPNHGRHHPALVAPPSDQSMLGLHPGFLSGENQRSGGQGRTWQARSALGEGGGGLKRRPETHRKEPGRTASNYLAKRSSKTSPKQLRSRTSRTSRATFASHSSRTSPPLPPIPPAAGVKRRRVVTSSPGQRHWPCTDRGDRSGV